RQQTFYWFEASQIPLNDFYSADVNFIKEHLGSYT
ncbi:TPA: DNA mismatch repair protein MutT, partial [Vibrio cholerae]|nr:DNA mismatch repair protein MutT [Vibrio cholerae]EGR4063678.1 DNA mismatch repair protein MutT [Vibrio cholerae]EIA3114581.1 DNA mismatch repair protein MutT [Vibrio cholerae]ELF6478279.1 DNA mismatch repair protein MutT [Vibrio cholerae]ELL7125047.1 DNA mismatch repair protein MutT [Vibrio cholerae]